MSGIVHPSTATMATPSGPIDLAARVVVVEPGAITVEFDMPSAVHNNALEDGWFHLGPLSSGVGARPFAPGTDVRLEARLDPEFLAGVQLVVDTPAGVSELLEALDATSPLLSEASWYACAASTEITLDDEDEDDEQADLRAAFEDGTLREGYRTAWGSGDRARRLPIVAYLAELLEQRFRGVEPLTEQSGFRWKLTGSDASWTCTAVVDENFGSCVLHSVIDASGDVVDRTILIERANVLNAGLLFGSWCIADGLPSIHFRSSVEIPSRVAAGTVLDRLISRHLDIVDEYASAFS